MIKVEKPYGLLGDQRKLSAILLDIEIGDRLIVELERLMEQCGIH